MSASENVEQKHLSQIASSLLHQTGMQTDGLIMRPSSGGGNNRVAVLEIQSKKYLLKNYYVSNSDTRDRLKHEWDFLCYAQKMEIDCVPHPVACDIENKIGIYEFIDGKKLSRDDVSINYVKEAITFVTSLNRANRMIAGKNLSKASESCFSIFNHIDLVEKRVARLNQVNTHKDFQYKLEKLIKDIVVQFNDIKNSIFANCKVLELDISENVNCEERCISPSDFGFHNALLSRGELVFLDFEYAGWDDPAKLVADFFCQPEIRVPDSYFDLFADGCFTYLSDNVDKHKLRTKILLPLFKLKWCCIMLNEFLPGAWERRKFAKDLQHEHYIEQITKVECLLNEMKTH